MLAIRINFYRKLTRRSRAPRPSEYVRAMDKCKEGQEHSWLAPCEASKVRSRISANIRFFLMLEYDYSTSTLYNVR